MGVGRSSKFGVRAFNTLRVSPAHNDKRKHCPCSEQRDGCTVYKGSLTQSPCALLCPCAPLSPLPRPPFLQPLRNLLVELCLLLPAQLRVLVELVLLPRLVQPLSLALQGPDDLVAQGLRTFEYWVDNLNPEYLEKALANVMQDVMGALWGLLKPSTTMRPHAVAAMQLLGKLGE